MFADYLWPETYAGTQISIYNSGIQRVILVLGRNEISLEISDITNTVRRQHIYMSKRGFTKMDT